MSLLLKYISTTPNQHISFKQTVQYIEYDINKGNLSLFWIISNENSNEYIERKDNNNNIQINVATYNGKNLLVKIVCFISCKKINNSYPIYFILTKYNLNIRKIIFNYVKKIIKDENSISETFNHMMRYFIILPENLYNKHTLNNKLSLITI